MDTTSFEPNSTIPTQIDQYPLLMERMDSHDDHEHIISITGNEDGSSNSSHNGQPPDIDLPYHEDRSSSAHQSSSSSLNRLNSRNSTFARRGDGYDRRRRSPLNSGLWISIELFVTVGQIIASIVVLSLSRNENPQAPLFAWVVGYASGCVATLPILYWRFRNRNQSGQQDSHQSHQGSSQNNPPDTSSYTAISVTQASEEDNFRSELAIANGQTGRQSSRLNGLMDHFKMALDCFFAVWFVVGNVWIFGGHSTPTDAPKLYKLCIVFLTFSCIGYAMPFILCATICCCLPCIISLLGFREDFSQTRGATTESINSLPIYKFKLQKSESVNDHDNSGTGEGGVLAEGTEKERAISGEDAICCICLNKYADNDELRELPCSHVFHVDCVDKWLKINASCPLCKSELGESSSAQPSARDSSQQ
ncbi:E3 ubiquitin-protein ligase At1g63170 [Ricinus communis]|uniref:E3 ubiquitin-protein ligase At1g63170 n=1 Tax=Ricinus communis TaxID=3988 RepID=UPI00201A65AB|nr:E3 ubiquitin-protein ligase At1g63170 [Ricinus communis]XP_048233481.1 E3 ubiquitin-protein ligase At1g63170 [Ricinus communis]